MRDLQWLFSAPWWEKALAGVETAIPAEWEQENGSVRMAGETAEEFLKALEDNNVAYEPEVLGALYDEVIRYVTEKTGQHPEGLTPEEWKDTYE